MLNLKLVSESSGAIILAHIENDVVHPLIGLEDVPGQWSFALPDVWSYPLQTADVVKEYNESLDNIRNIWTYMYENKPDSVCNRHLLFTESTVLSQIDILIKNVEKQLNQAKLREKSTKARHDDLKANGSTLTEHAGWEVGYWKGKISVLEDIIDDLNNVKNENVKP